MKTDIDRTAGMDRTEGGRVTSPPRDEKDTTSSEARLKAALDKLAAVQRPGLTQVRNALVW